MIHPSPGGRKYSLIIGDEATNYAHSIVWEQKSDHSEKFNAMDQKHGKEI